MGDFLNFAISYTIIQTSAIFVSIAIFSYITKNYYNRISINKYKRIAYYGIVGSFFGLWSFFALDNIPFMKIGLFGTLGLFITMFIYSVIVVSPFVFFKYRTN